MYIIIAGGGRIGQGLAKKLILNKHDVVLIDQNKNVCEYVYANIGAVTIPGDATKMEILESAKIDKCDILISVLPYDSDNITVAILAKHYNVPQILVRNIEPKYKKVFDTIGISYTANTSELLIDQLMIHIEATGVNKIMDLGDLEICSVAIPKKSKYIGKKISEIVQVRGFPEEIVICSIFKEQNKSYIVPRGNTTIEVNDSLYLCGTHKNILKATNLINKSNILL